MVKPIKVDDVRFVIKKREGLNKLETNKICKKVFKESERSTTNRYLVHTHLKKRK